MFSNTKAHLFKAIFFKTNVLLPQLVGVLTNNMFLGCCNSVFSYTVLDNRGYTNKFLIPKLSSILANSSISMENDKAQSTTESEEKMNENEEGEGTVAKENNKRKKPSNLDSWIKTSDKEESKKNKRSKKGENSNNEPESKKSKVQSPVEDSFGETDFNACEKTTPDGKTWNLKISSWNVAGIRAWLKKGGIQYIYKEQPDILALQETKCEKKLLPAEVNVPGYHTYWLDSDKKGYAGVALYSKQKPLEVKYGIGEKSFDSEGRLIMAEYDNFFLVSTYVVNAGQGLKTLDKKVEWNKLFEDYMKKLDAKKPVIIIGDLNVAHKEIDLKNPKTNSKTAGFTPEEREGMTHLLSQGFVDTFRHFNPDKEGAYTFWNYIGQCRSRNTGWRLDYFLVSERFLSAVCDSVIREKVLGSDHCPITLFLHV